MRTLARGCILGGTAFSITPMTSRFKQVAALAPSILVADRDDATRLLYQQQFALAGWNVADASDGRDALVKALIEPPSLIVTEIALPFIDGYALCEIFRRDMATASIPILVVTGEAQPAQIARATHAGADRVLVKPVPMEILVSEIRQLLTDSNDGRDASPGTKTGDARTQRPANTTVPGQGRRGNRMRALSGIKTTSPPDLPPALMCPSCDCRLTYEHSHVGGVSAHQSEQWDRYMCLRCGVFQYRHRTRELRRVS